MLNLPALNIVDIGALALIGLGGLRGYFRGLSGEFARLVGLLAALAMGVFLYAPFGDWIGAVTRLTGAAAQALAYLLLVVAAIVVMTIVGRLLKRLVQVVVAPRADRGLGFLMGAAKATVCVVIVFLAAHLLPSETAQQHFLKDSAIGTLLARVLPGAREILDDPKLIAPPANRAAEAPEPGQEDKMPPARKRGRFIRQPEVEHV
jgi:uncharacterized membrane protein required for colicin V production